MQNVSKPQQSQEIRHFGELYGIKSPGIPTKILASASAPRDPLQQPTLPNPLANEGVAFTIVDLVDFISKA